VEGKALDRRLGVRGNLRDLSVGGCCLNLEQRLPPGTLIEIRCDINGIGLRIRGRVVWAEAMAAGAFHGIALTGYESEEDALFHRLYIERLGRRQAEGAA
jgi:hypothetical protein